MLVSDWDDALGAQNFWERQAQTVLVTGAHSSLGCRVVERLNNAGWMVRVLTPVNTVSAYKFPQRVIEVPGSISDPVALGEALRTCHRVLHLEELTASSSPKQLRLENIEQTRLLVQACKVAHVRQFVLVSTAKMCYRTHSFYSRSKKTAEDVLRGSGLTWTIVRPTMVVGTDGNQEYRWLRRFVKRFRIVAIPESGSVVKRPVHEDDLADGLNLLLQASPHVVAYKTYNMAGRKTMTVPELVNLIAGEYNLPHRIVLQVPRRLCQWGTHILKWLLPSQAPVNVDDALRGLLEDCDPDIEPAVQDFGYHPRLLTGRLSRVEQRESPAQRPHPATRRALHPRRVP